MEFDLFVAATLYSIGTVVFGPFEERTPRLKKLFKLAFLLCGTALLSSQVGHWSLLFVVGMLGLGLGVHTWWTRKHGIGFFTPEPREKYYALRGWQ